MSDAVNKPMKIGLNNFEDRITEDNILTRELTDDGRLTDFTVCHVEGGKTLEKAISDAERLKDYFEKRNQKFITNYEYINMAEHFVGEDGSRWADNSQGCHRLSLPDEFIECLTKSPAFDGIMYDEFEHMIINRNPSIQIATHFKKIIPAFRQTDTKDGVTEGENLKKQLKEYVASFKKKGVPAFLGEHVYPVMFHSFAECGITPNYKSLKENLSDVAFAMASGASIEYNLPLYNCIDNWFMMTNPGHSAEEMYYNLLFAQKSGVDCAYVESIAVMGDDKGKLSPHGEKFRQFCEEYGGKERDYNISDYRPEIGIIHYDDSFWGSWYPILFKKTLFGNPKVRPDFRSKEIFRIFNIITHGETCKNGLSWARYSPWALKKHFSFVSMNSTAVFDHKADRRCLESLKLCFLCGIHISEETLRTVAELVNEKGLTAVTPKRFAPKNISVQATEKISEIPDGNGQWIVINSYKNRNLKKKLGGFLGNKGEMRLTFSDREIVMKIKDKGNAFHIVCDRKTDSV